MHLGIDLVFIKANIQLKSKSVTANQLSTLQIINKI